MSSERDELNQQLAEQYGIKQAVQEQAGHDVDDSYKEKLLDFSQSLNLIEQALRGYQVHYRMFEMDDGSVERWEFVRTQDGKWKPYHDLTDEEKEAIESKGLCNSDGVQVIMTFLQGVANPIVAASNFGRQKSYKTGFQDSTAIMDLLLNNMDEYGIDDEDELDVILAMIDTVIAGVLGKAEDSTLLEHLSKITKVSEIKTDKEDGKSRLNDLWGK